MKQIIHWLLLFVILVGALAAPVSADSDSLEPPPAVMSILSSMTPEERVGQLFLVTFTGTDTSHESAIYDLIVRHHIGGVILLSSNDNFTAAPGTLTDLQALITGLQQTEWDSSQTPEIDPETEQPIPSTYVPLMVGITKEGNGSVSDQILSGLTPLPSEMALGASWNPDLAAQVGAVQGQELSALGFNLILGPSLDVLELPATSTSGDLGTLAFGGDPYWVGEMGRAYVSGLHGGSGGRLLVVARHFPGRGGSNRLPEDEIPTIRKSLEQLKQIELAPFFDVTGNAGTLEASADGLLVSHIRYQGFQGNIRATTRPVSFDAQALTDILALPELSAWYSDGGLLVSDDIGTRSVYEFYTLGGDPFSAPFAARDAFLAGNDMLYLGKIQAGESVDTYTTTVEILDFFAQKYNEDPAFAQRVDTAVARILTKKYKLYGNFAYANVYNSADIEELIGGGSDITFNVARNAATLVSPEPQDLATVFPSPPQLRERVVFITDTAMVKQCNLCVEQPTLGVDALQQTVLRLYGPESGNQTSDFRLSSHSFQNLYDFLEGLQPPFIENDLTRADWIVISITSSSRGQPALVSRFIRERPELVRDKRIILFSFGAPYYFDSTDLSNITAYFALYSHEPPFVDVAARLLFKELTPVGASPVSIPAVGYDLISVMTPDPDQVISLTLDLEPVPVPTNALNTPEPTPIPLFRIGDTIKLRTGIIRDHNGRSVPDETVVIFSMVLTGEGGGILKQVETTTVQGVARTSFGLDKPGLLEISAASEPATISDIVQLDVSQSGAVAVTVVPPELTEPAAPIPTTPPAPPEDQFITPEGYPRINAWFISMLLISFSVWVGYWLSRRFVVRRAAIRVALGMLVGGLIAYNYLVFGMPGGTDWLTANGLTGALFAIILGELVGFGAGWFWSRQRSHER
ncbi:MAG: glycoside hydrolase family 3 N-terminal domain-containing protein [Chloroflexota bacterium]